MDPRRETISCQNINNLSSSPITEEKGSSFVTHEITLQKFLNIECSLLSYKLNLFKKIIQFIIITISFALNSIFDLV